MDKKFLSLEDINNINYKIDQHIDEIEKLKRLYKQKIDENNNNINHLKNILKERCNHNKVIDRDNIDEHTHYYCSICHISL